MLRRFVFFVFALAALLQGERGARASTDVDDIVARAKELGLAKTTEWRRLLLYKRSRGRWVSEVDGTSFFAATNGKTDPEAELEATLRSFFAPATADAPPPDDHGLCRFPARRLFLEARLPLEGKLPTPSCPALASYESKNDSDAIALVYASAYVENPSSAFGHTLLRLKKRASAPGMPATTGSSDEVDIGVDYTAETDTKNPILYAFKGIAGYFPGKFRYLPWDDMLRQYAGSDARDLWEYELALNEQEVRMLRLHLRELSTTRIDYLYFTENCSYQILAAIEAAAPRLSLLSKLRAQVFPLDTVKAVVETPGLVRNAVYRPSVRSLLRSDQTHLSSTEEDAVALLADDPDAVIPTGLDITAQRKVLEVAATLIDARHARAMIAGEAPNAVLARKRLVARRLALGGQPAIPDPVEPSDKRPDRSHDSGRITLGSGIGSQYGTPFAAVGWRLALHDLLDPPRGNPELTQLTVIDAQLRFDYQQREVEVARFMFVDLVQLNPLGRFEHRLSWRVRAFGERLHDRGCPDCFHHGAGGAVGVTLATRNERLAVFAMGDARFGFSGSLDGIGGSIVRVGIGPWGGVRARIGDPFVALVTASMAYLPGSDLATTFELRGGLRARLAKNVALGVDVAAYPLSIEGVLATFLYY